jgi:hypothetical protein
VASVIQNDPGSVKDNDPLGRKIIIDSTPFASSSMCGCF